MRIMESQPVLDKIGSFVYNTRCAKVVDITMNNSEEQIISQDERLRIGRLSGRIGILSNLFLFAVKLLSGILSHSVSVTADAMNNLSDASSSVVTLLGFRLANKPADTEHPYGHARFEYLSGLFISFLILTVGLELFRSSVRQILAPEEVSFGLVSFLILALSILVKIFLAVWNHRMGKKINSGTLLATSQDSRNDVVATLAVLICALVDRFVPVHLDGWAGAAVSVFILIGAIGLLRDTIDPLLGKAPEPEEVEQIREEILSYPGVLGTHDLMIHDYGPGRKFASVHVEMAAEADPLESHDTIDNIEREFHARHGIFLVIHYDPIVTSDDALNDVREWLSEEVLKIDPDLSVHDLRVVPGTTHTNLVFDVVRPPDCKLTESEVCAAIRKRVTDKYPDYFCVMTLDSSYAAVPHETVGDRNDSTN